MSLYDSTGLYDQSALTFDGQNTGVPGLPNVGVFIAFNDSPYVADPSWTEVTQYVRDIPSIRRARSDDWSTFTGSATLTLNNRDQRFNPYNASGPYYGKLLPRRQIKIVADAGEYINIIPNPSFETNTTGWSSGSGTITRVTTDAYSGTASCQQTTTANAVGAYVQYESSASAVIAGRRYTASCYVKNTAGTNRKMRMDIEWRTDSLGFIATSTGSLFQVDVGGGWVRLSVSAVAPAGAGRFSLPIYTQATDGAVSNVTLIDAVMFTETNVPVDYFDGSSVGCNWTGTANASSSYKSLLMPLFRGYIAGWPVEWSNNDEDSTVSIECFDALSLLTDESTPQDLSDPYITSLNPVYYLPFSDPIDPNAAVNPIKSAGSSTLNITYDPAIFRFINSGRLGEGMAPSAVNITSASNAFGFVSGSASPRPPTSAMTMMCWWTTSSSGAVTSGSPPTSAFNNIVASRFTNLNVLFNWYELPRMLEVIIRLVTSPTTYLQKNYTSPIFIDPTTPHHVAIIANADGTLAGLYSDGQQLTTTLAYSGSETGSLDILPDFYSFQGERQSLSAFNYVLSLDQIKQAYALGAGRVQESTTARFNRLLSTTRFPTALTSPPASPQGTVSEIKAGGNATVNELNIVRNSEGGELYISKDGVVVMTERNSQLKGRSATTQAYFKDDGTALKYSGNFTLRFDADSVVNDLRYSVTGGLDVNAFDSNSQSAYGKQSYSVDTYLSTVSDAQSLANSRLAIFDTPVPQVSPLEVGITRSQADWQNLLSLELMDQIEVTRTPKTGSVFSDRLLVNEISHSINPNEWSMQITGSARFSEWFTIDIDFIDGDRLIA